MSEIEKASDHFFQGYCDKDKYCDYVDGSFQQPFVMEYEIDEFTWLELAPKVAPSGLKISATLPEVRIRRQHHLNTKMK